MVLLLAALITSPDVHALAKRAMDSPAVVAYLRPDAVASCFEEAASAGAEAVAVQASRSASGELGLLAWAASGEPRTPLAAATDLARGHLPVFVELRQGEGVERQLFEHLLERALLQGVAAVTADLGRIVALRRISRSLFTVWSVEGVLSPARREGLFAEWERGRSNAVALPESAIDEALAAEAKRLKIPLMALDVEPGDVRRLKQLRVAFLATADPRGVLAELR